MFITSAPILLVLCATLMKPPDAHTQRSGESEAADMRPRVLQQIKTAGYTLNLLRRQVEFRSGEYVQRAIALWIEAVDVAKKEKRAVWREYIRVVPLVPGEPRDFTMAVRDDKHAAVAYLERGNVRFREVDLGHSVDVRAETVRDELKRWSWVLEYDNTASNISLAPMLKERKRDYRKVAIKAVLWKQDSWNVIVSLGDAEVTWQRGRDAKTWTMKKSGP